MPNHLQLVGNCVVIQTNKTPRQVEKPQFAPFLCLDDGCVKPYAVAAQLLQLHDGFYSNDAALAFARGFQYAYDMAIIVHIPQEDAISKDEFRKRYEPTEPSVPA